MAIRTLSKGKIRFSEGSVNEKKSVLSSDDRATSRAERIAFRKKAEATSVEYYLNRQERKYWEHMRPSQKQKVIKRAIRRSGVKDKDNKYVRKTKKSSKRLKQQLDAKTAAFDITATDVTKSTSGQKNIKVKTASSRSDGAKRDCSMDSGNRYGNESKYNYEKRDDGIFKTDSTEHSGFIPTSGSSRAAEEGGKEAVSVTTETASTAAATASGGTTEAVKAGIKVAKKAAENIKQAVASMEQTRDEQVRAEAASNPAHASGILGAVQNGAAILGAAITAGFMTILQPILLILLPVIVIAGILGAILSPISALEDNELFPNQLNVEVDDEQVQAVLDMANKLLGTPYKMGGNDPATGIDCSGFTTLCFRAAGVNLPRTAQGQYDVSKHFLDESEAVPGDLVFYTGTYNAGRTVTHVEIYLGDGNTVGAGDPVRVTSLHSPYFQAHFYSFGRILERKEKDEDSKEEKETIRDN
ncbi:MAG: C40 family peptidase [Lachnospiraceae bacterium]|nr:C40 family peptidase [Lachnospiraceae bacterium]